MGRHAPVPARVTQYLEVQHSADERAAHRLLAEYAASRRKAAGGDAGRAAADFVTTLLKKRMFSSPKAFAETVETHLKTMTQAGPPADSQERHRPGRGRHIESGVGSG